jgi:hypothetical protein
MLLNLSTTIARMKTPTLNRIKLKMNPSARRRGISSPSLHACLLGFIFSLGLGSGPLVVSAAPSLNSRDQSQEGQLKLAEAPFAQGVPVVSIALGSEKRASFQYLTVEWRPTVENGNLTTVSLNKGAGESRAGEMFRTQAWTALFAASLAIQEPWGGADWGFESIPSLDYSGTSAALAVGFVSAASHRKYPAGTVVMGNLAPDGTVAPVPGIISRLEAAASARTQRVILSDLQRFDVAEDGSLFNISQFARTLGMECLFVERLHDAIELVLGVKLPKPADFQQVHFQPTSLNSFLDVRCRQELEALSAVRADPSDPQAELIQAGLSAYKAGQLYVTYDLLREANAKNRIGPWRETRSLLEKTPDEQLAVVQKGMGIASQLRDKIQAYRSQRKFDHNEIQSALVLAEESDFLNAISAKLEGAEIVASHAFATRSLATKSQKERAIQLLSTAIQESDYALSRIEFFSSLYQNIQKRTLAPLPNRVEMWSGQLTPIYLAAAEYLPRRLKMEAAILRDDDLINPRLIATARKLRDAHVSWEQQVERRRRLEFTRSANQESQPVGFSPGASFAPPEVAMPAPLPDQLSPTAHLFAWVNDYCEVAALNAKFLGPDSGGGKSALGASNRDMLQRMLRHADMGALQAIALAGKVGVDPAMLLLIYERASYLRASEDEERVLESLRQYWRCNLLGNLCWQLMAKERVVTTPQPSTRTLIADGSNVLSPTSDQPSVPMRTSVEGKSDSASLESRVFAGFEPPPDARTGVTPSRSHPSSFTASAAPVTPVGQTPAPSVPALPLQSDVYLNSTRPAAIHALPVSLEDLQPFLTP